MSQPPHAPRGLFRSVGPALIVACVVLGPGSISTSTQVGSRYGYSMIWVLVVASVLMVTMVALAARLGVVMEGTMGDEVARRVGRPFAAFVGVVIFLIVASFQSSNNIAVVAGIEPLMGNGAGRTASVAMLVALNALIVVMLFAFKKLYRPIEWMMMVLVGLMLVGFLGNLAVVRPSVLHVLGGFVPRIDVSRVQERGGWMPLLGLVGTTLSVAGAYYQAYLVREKGWTKANLRQGLFDSIAGIAVLGGISIVIMATSAAILRGKDVQLENAADMAAQLEPLFGASAKWLFSTGFLAAAFSSFMVNAMIGGTLLSDGLGLGARMDQTGPKVGTVLALLAGMGVAIAATTSDFSRVGLIIFAQALTVLGLPVVAFTMLWLATRKDVTQHVPLWMKTLAAVACLVTLLLAYRTAVSVYLQLTA